MQPIRLHFFLLSIVQQDDLYFVLFFILSLVNHDEAKYMKDQNARRKFYKRWRFWVFFVVPCMFFIVAIILVININKSDEFVNPLDNDTSANGNVEMPLHKPSQLEINQRGKHADAIDSLLSESYDVHVFTRGDAADILVIQSEALNTDSLSKKVFDEYKVELRKSGFTQVEIGSGTIAKIFEL